MTAEETVKAKWPDAESFNIYAHVCGVFAYSEDEVPIGIGFTEAEAWEDAASRIGPDRGGER